MNLFLAVPLITTCALLLCSGHVDGAETRSAAANSTRQAKRVSASEDDQLAASGNCASLNYLAKRVDTCAKPLMDIISGNLTKWPETEDEAMVTCEQFGYSERCIKETSRKCAKGIQKTIISTIGTSVQRVRKRECSRSKANDILRTMQCIRKNQKTVQDWMNRVTVRLEAIEAQQPSAEKKINSVCCMVRDIENELVSILDPFCPNEAKWLKRLFRGVVDNAVDLVCRNPKCTDHLKGLKISKSTNFQGLIEIILRIVFSLDTSE